MMVFEFRPDIDESAPWAPWTREDGKLERVADLIPWGQSACDVWIPPRGHLRLERHWQEADFPNWLDPVLSLRAREAMADLLDPGGEWLPLVTTNGGEFFIYNVLTVLDCVDHERSRIRSLPDGEIYGVDRIVFDESRIPEGTSCFRVPEGLTTTFYMLGHVVDRINETGLQGLDPRLIWDTEHGGRFLGLVGTREESISGVEMWAQDPVRE